MGEMADPSLADLLVGKIKDAWSRPSAAETLAKGPPGMDPLERIARGTPAAEVYPEAAPAPSGFDRFMASPHGHQLGILANFLGPGVRAPMGARVPTPVRAPEGPQGIRAYHGSPHDFDRFDMSKIGTGEGAQAYGHGLYFAESEGVARGYKERLSTPADYANISLSRSGNDIDAAMKMLEGMKSSNPDSLPYIERGLRDLQAKKEGRTGRMYEVSINAHPDDFLDWDKPLSQQSESVRSAMAKVMEQTPNAKGVAKMQGDPSVQDVYSTLGISPRKGLGPQTMRPWLDRERELVEAGIPGIRYKDAMSRGSEGGTSNYVVFNDKLVDIVRKYGLAGLLAAGAASSGGGDASAKAP